MSLRDAPPISPYGVPQESGRADRLGPPRMKDAEAGMEASSDPTSTALIDTGWSSRPDPSTIALRDCGQTVDRCILVGEFGAAAT